MLINLKPTPNEKRKFKSIVLFLIVLFSPTILSAQLMLVNDKLPDTKSLTNQLSS